MSRLENPMVRLIKGTLDSFVPIPSTTNTPLCELCRNRKRSKLPAFTNGHEQSIKLRWFRFYLQNLQTFLMVCWSCTLRTGCVWESLGPQATCLSRVAFARLEDLPNQTKTFPGEVFIRFLFFCHRLGS